MRMNIDIVTFTNLNIPNDMKEKKYTLEEIKKMLEEGNFFAYDTALGDQADEHAADYDYDEYGTLNAEEAVRDAFVYGAHWVIDHLITKSQE